MRDFTKKLRVSFLRDGNGLLAQRRVSGMNQWLICFGNREISSHHAKRRSRHFARLRSWTTAAAKPGRCLLPWCAKLSGDFVVSGPQMQSSRCRLSYPSETTALTLQLSWHLARVRLGRDLVRG